MRYLALGDSFTIGTGSSREQAFPARLAARCAGRMELRDLAVNGYSTVARDGLHPSAEAHDAWAAEIARRGAGPCSH